MFRSKLKAIHLGLLLSITSMMYLSCMLRPMQPTQSICKPFRYVWPLENVSNIVREIIEIGSTKIEPINNIYDEYRILLDARCHMETNVIILVKSFARNVQQRYTIRKTWASCRNIHVQIVFLLGQSKDYMEIVKNEQIEYSDIIQGSFEDIYKNNIFKTHMAYDWVTSRCKQCNWAFFVDDDYFVNIPNLLKFIHKNTGNKENSIFGYQQCNREPVRLQNSEFGKWYISAEEYPFNTMPPFISGGSILAHINVVRKLRIAFPFSKRIWLDDVFVSLVALQLNIKLTHEEKLINTDQKVLDVKDIISHHSYNTTEFLYKGWVQMKTISTYEWIFNRRKPEKCP